MKRPQNLPENLLELRIQSLCRFVKEQNVRVQKQDFCQRCALLFTAGAAEVIAKSVFKAYTSNGATLSVLLYLRAFEDGDFASAWGIGAVLLVLVLLINLAARLAKTKLKQKQ